MTPASSPLGYIRGIAAYQPGKPTSELAREMGLEEAGIVKLASNENPLGASPLARAAVARACSESRPLSGRQRFRAQARVRWPSYKVEQSQIVLGSGSNDVLELVAHVFLAPGTSAVYAQHAFAVYPLATQTAGAAAIVVPARRVRARSARDGGGGARGHARALDRQSEQSHRHVRRGRSRFAACSSACRAAWSWCWTKPTTSICPSELRADTTRWLEDFPNLVITRTFSKAYGLAALRVGYALAHPDVADLMNRVRMPFNVNAWRRPPRWHALDGPRVRRAQPRAERRRHAPARRRVPAPEPRLHTLVWQLRKRAGRRGRRGVPEAAASRA